MPGGQGYRARTRDMFKRGFRQKGFIPLSTYLRTYKLGDYVDIKVNGAVQKVGNELKRLELDGAQRGEEFKSNKGLRNCFNWRPLCVPIG